MRKIGLFLAASQNDGGVFEYSRSILDALDHSTKLGFEVEVLYCDSIWKDLAKKTDCTIQPAKHSQLGLLISQFTLWLFLPSFIEIMLNQLLNPLVKQIKSLNCDYWVFPIQDALAFQSDVKCISTIHDLMHRYEPEFEESSSFFRYHIRENRFKKLCKHSEFILVDSSLGKNHVLESYEISSEKLLPLPFVSNLEGESFNEKLLEKKFNFLPQKFMFYPSKLWPHKNHKNLFLAMKSALEESPDLKLLLTGLNEANQYQLENILKDLNLTDSVVFLGYLTPDELKFIYHKATFLIMPTLFGPTNIPPLEALVMECPMALSGNYAMKEQAGDAAIYFNPTDVTDISNAISRLWCNEQLRMKQKKYSRLKKLEWNQEAFNSKFCSYLESLEI